LLEYETLTLEKGNYNGLVGSAPSIINIPNGSTLEIPAGTKMSNYEFRLSGGALVLRGESRNFVVLNNVRIRITGSAETGWSEVRMNNVQMKGGSIHTYEPNVNPKKSMIWAQGCTFEGLDLPIYIHNSYSTAWFHSNVFLKSRGIVLGYDHSWENGYIQLLNNTFIEGQGAYNTYLIDLAANSGMEGLASEKIIFKYNNFFSSANVKSIYFADNFPSNTEKLDLGNTNFFWNESNGQALITNSELSTKIRTPSSLASNLPWQIEYALTLDNDEALYYFDFRWSEPDYKTY
jgi:hypothetical protein